MALPIAARRDRSDRRRPAPEENAISVPGQPASRDDPRPRIHGVCVLSLVLGGAALVACFTPHSVLSLGLALILAGVGIASALIAAIACFGGARPGLVGPIVGLVGNAALFWYAFNALSRSA